MNSIPELRVLAAKAPDEVSEDTVSPQPLASLHAKALLTSIDAILPDLLDTVRLTVDDFVRLRSLDRPVLCRMLADALGDDAAKPDECWAREIDAATARLG
jgi:hypothetical protein